LPWKAKETCQQESLGAESYLPIFEHALMPRRSRQWA